MRAYSLDLREKVIATVDEKELSQREIAKLFKVSFTWVKKLLVQRQQLGHVEPLPHGGGQKLLLDGERLTLLRQAIKEKPDATLQELCEKIKGPKRKPVHPSTMCRTLSRLKLTRKKKGAHSYRAG